MASAVSAYNDGFTESAVPPNPITEHSEESRILSPLSLGHVQNPQELLDIAPVIFSFGEVRSDDPRTAQPPPVLDSSPCLAADSNLGTQLSALNDISDNAELLVTCRIANTEPKLPSGLTTIISSLDISALAPIDTDAQPNTREVLPCEYVQPRVCDVETPGPSPSQTPGALRTPSCLVKTVARHTSSSPDIESSGVSIRLTSPLSSPQTDCDTSAIESPAGGGEMDCSSSNTEIGGYPAITMSSPNFGLHEDEPSSSPSPPHQATSAKRAQCNITTDVRCQKLS
jgi:hypothetical protein